MIDTLFYLFIFLLCLQLTIKISLNFINIGHIKRRSHQVPAKFQEKIDLESHQKAAQYSIEKMKFASFGTLYHSLILFAWIGLGGLNFLDVWARGFNLGHIATAFIVIGALSAANGILSLPEELYQTFVLEEKFGFNKTTLKIFFTDKLKELIISALFGSLLLFAILKIMDGLGQYWWFFAASFIIAFQFVMLWAYPRFIAPLFNKFSPLDDQQLKGKIEQLLQKIQLNFKDFYIMNASLRSSHGNAYFTGFGKNRRIVFFDTLLKTLDKEEVVSVLAHELGHLKKKHILKTIIVMSLFLYVGFYILGKAYLSESFYLAHNVEQASTYMALILFMYIAPLYIFPLTPVNAWLSRKNEYEADQFAVENADGSKLIDALVKMYKDNSSTLTPSPLYSKFYFSHPPAKERIEFIEKLQKG